MWELDIQAIQLNLFFQTKDEVKFRFLFLSFKFYAQWKIWLIRQSTIHGFKFEEKFPVSTKFEQCFWLIIIQTLIASVKSQDQKKFCDLLKSLRRLTFEIFGAPNGEDLNRMCCDFLEGKSVRIVTTCGLSRQRAKSEIQDWYNLQVYANVIR